MAIPAGRALGNRLALMRSLRPLRRRHASATALEIDEEGTADASAEVSDRDSITIRPVFRLSQNPWYDVDVVTEDDPAIEVWKEAIRDFCQVLRDTGAFRIVRSWRLRIDDAEDIEADASAAVTIESPTGKRLPSRTLMGTGTRRLIFFVTHGTSPLWRDGTYARVLEPWCRHASVVLLHMLRRERWPYTTLGDSHGLSVAERPGLPSALIGVEPFWWQLPADDVSAFLKVSASPLDPAALGDWASMLMGRGARSAAFLLDPLQQGDAEQSTPALSSKRDFERAIAQLREASPEAFLLAVYLSPSHFTIPVARLIQDVKLGAAVHPTQLGELFLSGLVYAKAEGDTAIADEERYFAFWPQAREILLQSLRNEDARSIAAELERRVSRHIEEASGRTITFRGLVPRADGTYELPDWAQPFARVASSVLGLPKATDTPVDLVGPAEETAVPNPVVIGPGVGPGPPVGGRSSRSAGATLRMYRQGYGDCFLLTLKRARGDYHVLVNCGVMAGTPGATAKMSNVVRDIRYSTGDKIDALIVTQAYWNKVSGFQQARRTFDRIAIQDVIVGWWEDPNDVAAAALRKEQRTLKTGQSWRAMEHVKRSGQRLIYLQPSDRLELADTGASIYCFGASRDPRIRRREYFTVPGLDLAIETASGDVLLFLNRSREPSWSAWRSLTWRVHDREITAVDLLARVVLCKLVLMGSEAEEFERDALPLMPRLRALAIPVDREMLTKRRWRAADLRGIERVLRKRGGFIWLSDEDGTGAVDTRMTSSFFDLVL